MEYNVEKKTIFFIQCQLYSEVKNKSKKQNAVKMDAKRTVGALLQLTGPPGLMPLGCRGIIPGGPRGMKPGGLCPRRGGRGLAAIRGLGPRGPSWPIGPPGRRGRGPGGPLPRGLKCPPGGPCIHVREEKHISGEQKEKHHN